MIPSTVRILVCSEPQDMRRSFDGLSLAVKQYLGEDPHSGALFCFINKRRNRLKVLWADGNGQCILYKRAHGAKFVFPDKRVIDAGELGQLLRGVEKDKRRQLFC
jgi:transposase